MRSVLRLGNFSSPALNRNRRLAAVADKHEGVMRDLKLIHGQPPLSPKSQRETTLETLTSIKSAGKPVISGRRRFGSEFKPPAARQELITSPAPSGVASQQRSIAWPARSTFSISFMGTRGAWRGPRPSSWISSYSLAASGRCAGNAREITSSPWHLDQE
jgi:hypothetical protein